MSRVDERAEAIYAFLKQHLNKPYLIGDLCRALRLQNSETTHRAVNRARVFAEADGLSLPIACPANGFTYMLTDSPVSVVDPALHLTRVEQGVRVTKEVHQDFIKSRLKQLDPKDRPAVKAWLAVEDGMRQVAAGAAALTKALVSMRKDERDEDDA